MQQTAFAGELKRRIVVSDRQTHARTDGRMDERTHAQTDGRTDKRTQREVAESASQIIGAECRVRQTHARTT
jgi:hypothetical protein